MVKFRETEVAKRKNFLIINVDLSAVLKIIGGMVLYYLTKGKKNCLEHQYKKKYAFLSSIVTEDKKWRHHFKPKDRRQRQQW